MEQGDSSVNPNQRVRYSLAVSPAIRCTIRSPATPASRVSNSHGDIQMEENEDDDDDDGDYIVDQDGDGDGDEDEDEDNNGIEIAAAVSTKKERKFRAESWKEYVRVYDEEGEVIKGECKHCGTKISAKQGAGTSGLKNHLKRREVRKDALGVLSQLNATLASPNGVAHGPWSFDAAVSRRELVKMIALHAFPFSIVEFVGFRSFVASLNPAFKMVSRRTVRNDCLKAFEEEKKVLKVIFESSSSRISLTMGMWTSNQTLGYMCVTAHFIDESWKMQKRIIKFAVLETPHTGIAMYNAVLKCIQDWKCEDNFFSITLDNASSNGAMIKLLKPNLLAKHMLVGNGKLLHQRCGAHVLNLICQAGLTFLDPIMSKIRESVKYITVSQGRDEKFGQIVKQQGITYGKGLILDVATRWNTSYLMLNTAKHYKSVFDSLAVQDVHYTYAPTFDEWERVEVICRLLDVFYDATKVISGSKYPTSNLHFHEFWKVRLRLQIEESEVDPYIYDTVKYMRKKFEKYWNLSWMALSIPVILDPQFKYPFLQFRFQQAFGDNASSQFSKVKSLFGHIFDEYAEMSNSGSTQQGGVDIGMGTGNNDSLADWDHHLSLTTTSSNLARSELDSYLKKPPIPRSDKFDILSWWQMNSVEFPILARMARDVLAVPASTVASESAFSTGGRVISDYRSRLTPEAAEALICLQDWYRASGSSELAMESIDDMLGHEDS